MQRISSGSVFESEIGYSRAVIVGDLIFVSGTTGYDYATHSIAADPLEQAEQAFQNIEKTLAQAGACFADILSVRYIFTDRQDFERCKPVLKKYLGEVKPAATLLIAGLLDPQMKLEIEVIARKSPPA
ncbi:hypothetical protein COW36_10425 [bacterium (Candidatus Blackallbacteria) CG17_big_fil_post_rev_8_21_14_2_50_48_46]|uniref:RidA family protein n=1 Tax=bacterium (Candidatus Blackallbacteria) CG17_big_fil_post_rev_8_21_14_2_50_48_46 TaxID=2014261 RepID=A0A2M7G527_9BACT|nr:MAG: hypothetical protein COW64_20200 [bacterium (Candidatus Blackallbacteria) CG18_big_fil_WC_8_21_14_2_50_49_26]PIW17047.1 MAG: hypothetical protein COW36_10425 [bacterium (Candidatus Blackallbacteria) CG17_big_fil_post_rev_8_21_14_2_50_48_46]PIW47718.1 MAG: hypothetical protein COW20_11795 [bacterium (Candidatus Blackallbacteria) CG13_big_fil_rev_8_21_14_2_50_49_14]